MEEKFIYVFNAYLKNKSKTIINWFNSKEAVDYILNNAIKEFPEQNVILEIDNPKIKSYKIKNYDGRNNDLFVEWSRRKILTYKDSEMIVNRLYNYNNYILKNQI